MNAYIASVDKSTLVGSLVYDYGLKEWRRGFFAGFLAGAVIGATVFKCLAK